MLDYEKSIDRLIERVKLINTSDWKPAQEIKELGDLINQLKNLAAMMDMDCYWDLEEEFNQPQENWQSDGTTGPKIERAGFYSSLRWKLLELAEFAAKKKESLPNPRQRHALPFAAKGLLHIMRECNMDRPALYNDSKSVQELKRICEAAGIVLSNERLRGALSEALADFSPTNHRCDGMEGLFVFHKNQ